MGLTSRNDVLRAIRRLAPASVLLPQEIKRSSDSVVFLDLTQLLRGCPGEVTGTELGLWFWERMKEFASANSETKAVEAIVCVMDKPSWIPKEKFLVQQLRTKEAPRYSDMSVFDEDGVCSMDSTNPGGDTLWHKFRPGHIVSNRPLRGRLVDWLVRFITRHLSGQGSHRLEPIGCKVFFEYEWPDKVCTVCSLETNNVSCVRKDLPEWQNETGEADLVQLLWLDRFPACDFLAVHIDSDQIPISLLSVAAKPQQEPRRWVWISCLHDWTQDEVVAQRQRDLTGDEKDDFGDEIVAVPTSRGRKRKRETAAKREEPVFCLDLLLLAQTLGRVKSEQFALACILCGTDYYHSKQAISPRYSFDDVLAAVVRNWRSWRALLDSWQSLGAWSLDRLRETEQKTWIVSIETFESQVRWQLHVLMVADEEDGSDLRLAEEARPSAWYQERHKECMRRKLPSTAAMTVAYHQGWFSWTYWVNPFAARADPTPAAALGPSQGQEDVPGEQTE